LTFSSRTSSSSTRRREGTRDTVFVIFGEHGVRGHDDVIHEEGLRPPMIFHDPSRRESGERIERPANQLDVPPTVLGLSGYEVEGGEYPDSPLSEPPANRPLRASRAPDSRCMASIEGYGKYIHHFDREPEEFYELSFYELSEDPLEKYDLAEELGPEELERRARVGNTVDPAPLSIPPSLRTPGL
jgi:arylsulfatase A-like enzyme